MQCKDNETRTKLCKNEKKNPKVTYDNSKFNVNKTKLLRANSLRPPPHILDLYHLLYAPPLVSSSKSPPLLSTP